MHSNSPNSKLIGFLRFIAYVSEHEPTKADACAALEISSATFKRHVSLARMIGVDLRAVAQKNSTETYYMIKNHGIFSRAGLRDMRI